MVDKPKQKPKETEIKRLYAKDMELDSDLFKLEVAHLQKNLSYDDKNPILVGMEHCHTYRTYDSDGKKHTRCNAIGGHHHDIELFIRDGEIQGECSPPIGAKIASDNHTHKVSYLRSDKISIRVKNPEAQAYIAGLK